MYLRNLSKSVAAEELQLNAGSSVWVDGSDGGATGTGLENCARVAFIVSSNTVSASSDGEQARAIAGSASDKVVIWEPNYKDHTQAIVDGDERIDTKTSEFKTLPIDTDYVTGEEAQTTVSNISSKTKTTGLAELENVFRAEYTDAQTGVTAATTMTDVSGANVTIPGNTITKVRVYIWFQHLLVI